MNMDAAHLLTAFAARILRPVVHTHTHVSQRDGVNRYVLSI
jgi:hypothetical protein